MSTRTLGGACRVALTTSSYDSCGFCSLSSPGLHKLMDLKGFSPRNLKYVRAFAEGWPEEAFVQAVLAQITWYHNLAILEKIPAFEERIWYAKAAIQQGWSRNVREFPARVRDAA